jgi:hypothetical protein
MYSLPRWRIEAWRWLTLGSGNRKSQLSPRPMMMRGESKVSSGAGEVSLEQTRRVSAIGAR